MTSSTVPSRELFGAQPGDHSSGAGALPGFQDEPHVARLPEESAHPQYDSGPMDTAGQLSLMPSEEMSGNESAVGDARHVDGVGALIGGRDESSVALAPDERAGLAASSTTTGTGTVTQPKDQAPSQPREEHKDQPSASAQKSGHHGLPNKVSSSPSKSLSLNGWMDGRWLHKQLGADEHMLPGDPGTGRFTCLSLGNHGEEKKPCETQANLLSATLRPRAHALGAERANWGTVPLNGDAAREELDTDFDDDEWREVRRVQHRLSHSPSSACLLFRPSGA